MPRRCRGLDLRGGCGERGVVPRGGRGKHRARARDKERARRRVQLIVGGGRAVGVEEGHPGGRGKERVGGGGVVIQAVPHVGVGDGGVSGGQGEVRR
uniref:Uncharacterized protein n=1 Tax=Arundo donax TaxID=35708 RepID=A0A0A9BYM3_ARUDO